jgi:hypothetical protein
MKGRWVILLTIAAFTLVCGCGDPPTQIGEVCQTDQHCGATEGTLTLTCDHLIPGGSCTVSTCTVDDPTTEMAEDEASCPTGSRCVREHTYRFQDENICRGTDIKKCFGTEDTRLVCRRECGQQSECNEVILCGKKCETVDEVEVCEEEYKNRMECVPFWSVIPEDNDDAPRACVLFGSDCVYEEPKE